MNMAALVNQSDLSGHQGKNLASIINFEHVNSEEWGDEWGCMIPAEHRAHAAYVYLDEYADRREGLIQAKGLVKGDKHARARIYKTLADKGWAHVRSAGLTSRLSLSSKLDRLGIDDPVSAARSLRSHATNITHKLPPAAWNHQIKLVFNTLAFEDRRRKAKMIDTLREPHSDHPPLCFFCARGVDSTKHIYGECEVVAKAKSRFCTEHDLHPVAGLSGACLARRFRSQARSLP